MNFGWLSKLGRIAPDILALTPLAALAPIITGAIGLAEGTGLTGDEKKKLVTEIVSLAANMIKQQTGQTISPGSLSSAIDSVVSATNTAMGKGGPSSVDNINAVLTIVKQLTTKVDLLSTRVDNMAGEMAKLTQDVTDNTSVVQSAITLLGNIKALLDAAGTDPTKLAALSSALEKNSSDLAAAVAANTPGGPVVVDPNA